MEPPLCLYVLIQSRNVHDFFYAWSSTKIGSASQHATFWWNGFQSKLQTNPKHMILLNPVWICRSIGVSENSNALSGVSSLKSVYEVCSVLVGVLNPHNRSSWIITDAKQQHIDVDTWGTIRNLAPFGRWLSPYDPTIYIYLPCSIMNPLGMACPLFRTPSCTAVGLGTPQFEVLSQGWFMDSSGKWSEVKDWRWFTIVEDDIRLCKMI